jgi:2-oxoglutarate ferredoxin oxidoreductase subunit alpha
MSNANGAAGQSNGSGAGAEREILDSVVIRFAGDSGDGMQLTGGEFTRQSAVEGNDISTFPDFPAEIRAPAGTLYGVSGFQLQFSANEIFTAGDEPQVLVAMNPAALRTNLPDLVPGGMLIADAGAFKKKNLELAGYAENPLENGSLDSYQLVAIDMAKAVSAALQGGGLSTKDVQRTRNFYALGLVFWLYGRDPKAEVDSIRKKFARKPDLADANVTVFHAGYAFGETTELIPSSFSVPAAKLESGRYRSITGNEATSIGLVAGALLADRRLFYASYPITPASSILEALSSYQSYPVTAFQAEDEIAAVAAAIGASFGGSLAVTGTSGPGFALKQEGVGLAVMAELPLVIIDVQRGGPSTGLPTKTEQGDLLQAIYGRNSESPVAVVAPCTPADCFTMAVEAIRLAVQHMCPVVYLSDNTLANGAEPWLLPDPASLPKIEIKPPPSADGFAPYLRDPETLARPWAPPGNSGLEHRIGGLEKEDVSGEISYDPENHEHMVHTRQAKIDRIADRIEPAEVHGDQDGDLLIVGFGGTYGALHQAVNRLREEGHRVGHLHLRYLSPLQRNVGELLKNYRNVIVAELNSGQLSMILRSKFLVDCKPLNKMQGVPFKVREVVEAARKILPGSAQGVHA